MFNRLMSKFMTFDALHLILLMNLECLVGENGKSFLMLVRQLH